VVRPVQALAHLVQDLDTRWQPGFDGVFGEQSLAEAVDRRDGGFVEVVERRPGTVPFQAVPAPVRQSHERLANPDPQLQRRSLGERDRREGVKAAGSRCEQPNDPRHEGRRLAGAGAGFHEERRVEAMIDRVTRRIVAEARTAVGRRHWPASPEDRTPVTSSV
jgi:hypothetical protein